MFNFCTTTKLSDIFIRFRYADGSNSYVEIKLYSSSTGSPENIFGYRVEIWFFPPENVFNLSKLKYLFSLAFFAENNFSRFKWFLLHFSFWTKQIELMFPFESSFLLYISSKTPNYTADLACFVSIQTQFEKFKSTFEVFSTTLGI